MLDHDQKKDFDALLPGQSTEAGATRRTALKTALGVGYAHHGADRHQDLVGRPEDRRNHL